jgi:hypothetical protein
MIFRWNDKDDKLVHIECWVDLSGLNEYGKPQNKWKKYLEFDQSCPEFLLLFDFVCGWLAEYQSFYRHFMRI